jgi:hypothetical protein
MENLDGFEGSYINFSGIEGTLIPVKGGLLPRARLAIFSGCAQKYPPIISPKIFCIVV